MKLKVIINVRTSCKTRLTVTMVGVQSMPKLQLLIFLFLFPFYNSNFYFSVLYSLLQFVIPKLNAIKQLNFHFWMKFYNSTFHFTVHRGGLPLERKSYTFDSTVPQCNMLFDNSTFHSTTQHPISLFDSSTFEFTVLWFNILFHKSTSLPSILVF